jgi:hypothetical protein
MMCFVMRLLGISGGICALVDVIAGFLLMPYATDTVVSHSQFWLSLQKQHVQLESQVQEERSKQEDPDEHQRLQQLLQELGEKKAALKTEQAELEVVDPQRFAAMKEACMTSRDSANRWLDNLYSLKQWCGKKFPGRESELDKFFEENGLTENVDYLD